MIVFNMQRNVLNVFFYITGFRDGNFEEERKRSVMAVFLIIGIAVILPFAVHHFLLGNVARAILLLAVGSAQFFSLFALHYIKQATGVYRLNVILLGVYLLFLIHVGGQHGSRLLWNFIFPLLSFFMLGKKEGFLWCVLQFLLSLILIADPGSTFGTFPYEEEIKSRFYVVYGVIVLMSYVVEATRDRYYVSMERNQTSLKAEIEERRRAEETAVAESSFRRQAEAELKRAYEDLERRISERTLELRKANAKLQIEIEERQSAEEELRSSERRLADIINFLPDATFVIDLDGNVIAWNQAIEDLTGIPAGEMLGRGNYEYGIAFYGRRRPVMIDLALNWDEETAVNYEYVKRVGTTLVSETRNPSFRKGPSLFWNTARPLFNADGDIVGAIEVIRDITERMLAEEALKAAEQEKEIILSSLMELVIYQDREMNILWANRAACEAAGLDRHEILGRHCYDIWANQGSLGACPDCPVRKAMDTGEPQVTELTTPDGRALILRGYPVRNSKNEIIGGIEVALDISDRKRAEAALQEAYNILNMSPAVAFLWQNTAGWPVEFATDNVQHLLGYTAGEFLTQKINYEKTVHPEDLDRVGQEVADFSAEKGRLSFRHQPYRIIAKDGNVKWVDDRTYIRRDERGDISHYQGIVMDITDQMMMQAALRESEARFRELAENIRDVFWLFDWRNQRLLYVSPAYEEIWGRPIEKLLDGREHWADTIHPDDADFFQESFQNIIKIGGGEPRSYRIHRPDGSLRWILDKGFAIKGEDGDVKHIAGVAEDVTEQKLAEAELVRHREKLEELIEERTRELAAAQDELLKSERLAVLGQLTATVSHELRNPLGVIRSSLFYLQKKYQGQDTKIKKHMSRIEDQVEICNMIVGDLLDFTRGRHSQTVQGEINPWLEHVLDEIAETGDNVIVRSLGPPSLRAFFDSEKLRRVIVNLLENAFQAVQKRKATAGDGPYQPQVKISSKEVESGVLIRVRDNGIGMDRQTLQRATEPLFTTKARGTGLGLAVVQKIIDEHGGTMTIRSRINTGTDVSIILQGSRDSKA